MLYDDIGVLHTKKPGVIVTRVDEKPVYSLIGVVRYVY